MMSHKRHYAADADHPFLHVEATCEAPHRVNSLFFMGPFGIKIVFLRAILPK
jgi:hypothetical protein